MAISKLCTICSSHRYYSVWIELLFKRFVTIEHIVSLFFSVHSVDFGILPWRAHLLIREMSGNVERERARAHMRYSIKIVLDAAAAAVAVVVVAPLLLQQTHRSCLCVCLC